MLKTDPILANVSVIGEISNLKFHSSGHVYFSLKDEDSKINCFLAASNVDRISCPIEDGMEIIAIGYISVYERGGYYSLNIRDIEVNGEGQLAVQFEKLKAKFEKEGLFSQEHKKPLPVFPSKIAVVTSETGAAVRDIIRTIQNKNDYVDILIYPVLVQGPAAAADIAKAINALNEHYPNIDIIITGRGGGSMEELWAFNEEAVARSIFASKIPVISAVGHETDFTICDFVSDTRAPTPSAAAELAVPDKTELMSYYNALHRNINAVVKTIYTENSKIINDMERMIVALSPEKELNRYDGEIRLLESRLDSAMSEKLTGADHSLRSYAAKLEGLNPMSVLARGYSVAEKDGEVLTKVAQLQTGDRFTLTLSDGSVTAQVTGD